MRRLLPPSLILLLAGCAPDLGPAPVPKTVSQLGAAQSLAAPAAPWPEDGWWRRYGDPQLDQLVSEAQAGSPDVATAAARLRSAQALAEQAGAALAPTVQANGSAVLTKQSYNAGIPREFLPKGWNDSEVLNIQGSFDLDLWGRNRARLRAAIGEARAAEVDRQQALLMLSTDIAGAYADLAQLYADRDADESAVRIRQSSVDLTKQRFATGLDNRGVEQLAESRLAGAQADLAARDEAIKLTRNRIAALVGAGPERGLAITRPRVTQPGTAGLPESIGVDLVGRRPDIVSARLRAEAASSRIDAAKAAYYPNVSFSGLIGLQSLGVDTLLKGGSSYGNVGPAFSLPIFDRQRLNGELRASRAAYDEAVASYDSALVAALHEVTDALDSSRSLVARRSAAAASVTAADTAYDIAKQRFQGGLATYLDVLSAEDTVLDRRRILADLDSRAFTLDVALVRALGGGFNDTAPATAGMRGPNG